VGKHARHTREFLYVFEVFNVDGHQVLVAVGIHDRPAHGHVHTAGDGDEAHLAGRAGVVVVNDQHALVHDVDVQETFVVPDLAGLGQLRLGKSIGRQHYGQQQANKRLGEARYLHSFHEISVFSDTLPLQSRLTWGRLPKVSNFFQKKFGPKLFFS
jgi:hypothetical protein